MPKGNDAWADLRKSIDKHKAEANALEACVKELETGLEEIANDNLGYAYQSIARRLLKR